MEGAFLATSAPRLPRPCDSCRSQPCSVYCRADVAYLCVNCDARIHAANCVASRHERVWICDACEKAPAEITCKADAAALCAACDAEVHSANPLARRHHRMPILPLSSEEVAMGRRTRGGVVLSHQAYNDSGGGGSGGESSNQWTVKNGNNGFLMSEEIDDFLDLHGYNSCGETQNLEHVYNPNLEARDGIVPARYTTEIDRNPQLQRQEEEFRFELEYSAPKSEYCYTTDSASHCVSFSSLDARVVPDSTITANSHGRSSKGAIDLFSGLPYPIQAQFSPMDREARVLRYREKRKMRKFEKTIRYASRKAYAETRPRIKGRFAKRSEVEVGSDVLSFYFL